MNQGILLSTTYLGPIQYFSKVLKYDKVFIEAHENFIKQTYRNRCVIYAANGELTLSIPVTKTNKKELIKDLKIDYSTNWQKLHWKSIESAYRSSPFFEYYMDELIPFYNSRYTYLLDFNIEIQNVIIGQLELETKISLTETYCFEDDLTDMDDFRQKIDPKKTIEDKDFLSPEYNQVFIDKHGFKPNLSIIDLLFNEGPNAINLLQAF